MSSLMSSFEDMSPIEITLCARRTALEAHMEFMWTAFFSKEDYPQETAKKVVETARSLARQGEGPVSPVHEILSEESEEYFNELFDKVLERVETLSK